MNERFQTLQNIQPEAEMQVFSVQELIDEGKTEALAQLFLGNEQAMIEIFGKVVTIDEMNKAFQNGLTVDQMLKISSVLGYRPATVGELKDYNG